MAVHIPNRDRCEAYPVLVDVDHLERQEVSDPTDSTVNSQSTTWSHKTLQGMSNKKRKQVAGDAASFKGEFSFVNKDASNIESKDHNAAVSWHVMNRYEKWKKQEQARKLRTSANIPINAPISTESSTTTAMVSLNVFSLHHLALHRALTRSQQDESTSTPYPPDPWQVENVEQSVQTYSGEPPIQQQSQTYTPAIAGPAVLSNQQLMSTAASSTSSSVVNLPGPSYEAFQFPPLVEKILSFAYGVMIPITWPNEPAKTKWAYEISRSWDDAASINADACYASAALCLYATLMASTTKDKDIASQACFFQVQAMADLRQRIANQTGGHDPSTLKAILKLFSAETALDNTSTARVHVKMLRSIVNAEGGIILLESWFRENLLSADCYFALKYETRPLFPASEWTPGPLSQPWKARLAAARVTGDHAPNVDSAIGHDTIRTVMMDLRELFKVEKYIDSHELSFDDQLLRWRQLRKFDCISRLADHQLNVKLYPHLHLKPKLQTAICAAIALISAMVLGSPEPVRFGVKLVGELQTKVQDATWEIEENKDEDKDFADEDPFADERIVIFWILYIGTLGEKTHPMSSEFAWFDNELQRMAADLGLRTQKEHRDVAKRFLFSLDLEDEIDNGRPHRIEEARKGVYEACGMSWRQPLEVMVQAQTEAEEDIASRKGKQAES
ncbi:hypothetical protein H2198_008649 [Neophaeococcomyces mojaviensis]|uniref:Uncharacterized protein n=1 Tax=Neophaeococcomyces mojaviensis TaxID=3383035 RepID=A0ACC2ZWN1_9EURO|nr:hypothetical protein H2198_008649 [Knufia sp. JES_112]